MPNPNEADITDFLFTTKNERAHAIAAIAGMYPNDEILAIVTPITDNSSAELAADRAVRVVLAEGGRLELPEHGSKRNFIKARYAELGRTGTHSMVELRVPVGSSFNFRKFYEQVDDLMTPYAD